MKKKRVALVTGFEPYGSMEHNPSAEIARRLDGRRVAGVAVIGRQLPVDLAALDEAWRGILREVDPVAVILLGLAPGEAVIRLERVALNLADFPIPDNAGASVIDRPVDAKGAAALWARLPLRAIQRRLLALGIPARLSESAGTYLCNVSMYRALQRLPRRVPCGFIHLPLLPAQVALAIEGKLAGDPVQERAAGGATPPSMAFPFQRRAVEIALEVTLELASPSRRAKA
jgi:pyroglutamyl-peptidase